jgi:hypothetical protein
MLADSGFATGVTLKLCLIRTYNTYNFMRIFHIMLQTYMLRHYSSRRKVAGSMDGIGFFN